MDFQERYRKHKTAIQKRWVPILKEVLLEEELGKQISILKKAKQQAAKEIQDQDELLAFLEYLDGELKWYLGSLNQNDSANAQGPVQRNETLNTGESKSHTTGEPVEKIDWEAGLAELTFMFEILFKNKEVGCSMKQYKNRWALIAKHFTVKGEEITSKGLRQAFNQLKINKDEGMPANHETYKTLLTMVQEIED